MRTRLDVTQARLAKRLAHQSTLVYVLGHAVDLLTTYLGTPDLAREANLVIARFGYGWSYILMSALVTSLLMWALQSWLWRRILLAFPDSPLAYKPFYRRMLFGAHTQSRRDIKSYAAGALVGIACILAYSVITSKLLTCVWNLSLLTSDARGHFIVEFILLKNVIAAAVGLGMFFITPYRLHRSMLGAR